MLLPLQNFTSLVGNAVAAIQGSAQQLLDMSVGSALRAIVEANASLALWLQWLIVQVLQMTRASTSNGPDLDTWVGDFSLIRLPATAAAGAVTLSRFVALTQASVPVGTVVRTTDGSQQFLVTADPTNPLFQLATNAYVIPAGTTSVTVPVQAAVGGAAGNVQSGAISLIAAALPNVDTVTNALALSGGVDAESDAALRQRFQTFLQTLSRATPLAVQAAVLNTRQGLSCTVVENVASDGSVRPGSFVVTVDDGSGHPPSTVLQAAATAIEQTRPVGATYVVLPPTILAVNIVLAVSVSPPAQHSVIASDVASSILQYVDTLAIGVPLTLTRLIQVAYNTDPSVTNVTSVFVNGMSADVSPGMGGVVKAISVQVN